MGGVDGVGWWTRLEIEKVLLFQMLIVFTALPYLLTKETIQLIIFSLFIIVQTIRCFPPPLK